MVWTLSGKKTKIDVEQKLNVDIYIYSGQSKNHKCTRSRSKSVGFDEISSRVTSPSFYKSPKQKRRVVDKTETKYRRVN